jgi:trehalose 6-phosphate synthase
MRKQVRENNIYRWAASVLGDLRELPLENSEYADPGKVGATNIRAVESPHRRLA